MIVDSFNKSGSTDNMFAGSASPYVAAKDDMGQEDFLRLLLTQLQHQDPLNPMDSTEFTTQLAQYSSLEQLVNANTKLESLNQYQQQNRGTQAIDFIGKEVAADGDQVSLGEDKSASGGFSIERDAQCTVHILDAGGTAIGEVQLGSRSAGDHTFEWDGETINSGKASKGVYYFAVEAVNAAGEPVEALTRISGQVSRVSLEGGEPMLYIGEIPLLISEIQDIQSPEKP